MNGGHFDYQQYRIRDIANTIRADIYEALKPKPEKVHYDYWTVDMYDHYPEKGGWSSYCTPFVEYRSSAEAVKYVKRNYPNSRKVRSAPKHPIWREEDIVYEYVNPSCKPIIQTEKEAKSKTYIIIHHAVYDD